MDLTDFYKEMRRLVTSGGYRVKGDISDNHESICLVSPEGLELNPLQALQWDLTGYYIPHEEDFSGMAEKLDLAGDDAGSIFMVSCGVPPSEESFGVYYDEIRHDLVASLTTE